MIYTPIFVEPIEQEEDMRALVQLTQICFPDNPAEAFPYEQLQWFQKHHIVCGVYDNEMQDWIAYGIFLKMEDELNCISLGVHPKHRRQGLAQRLMTFVMQSMPNHKMSLMVRTSNTSALALYHKLGFCIQGVQPKAYTQPVEDGVHFMLSAHFHGS